jgi:lysophospholipase L1-like esterase
MKKNLRYTTYLFISVIILMELLLRIYNPFQFRVKGDHIILEANKKYIIDNSGIPVLDKTITHTKNSLGFRGAEKPANFDDRLTMLSVGGSATECAYLNDGKTWTDVLFSKLQNDFPQIWMNNAGIAGHSSFGHIALIKEHITPLHPDYVLVLAGANDIRRTKLSSGNESIFVLIARNSELCNVILNIARTKEAKTKNLTDTYIDLNKADSIFLSEETIADFLKNEESWVNAYEKRLDTIIDICVSNNIKPILVTQPSMVGAGRDPLTNVSLETLKLKEKENGKLWWTMLEKYNDGTRRKAIERKIPLIDLAHLLPKSSEYFYDVVHLTNKGAEKTGNILYDSVRLLLHHY